MNPEGTIVDGIYYQADGKYRCVCGRVGGVKLDRPISSTYCLCCAGHFRHHLQKALDVNLRLKEVVSSPLATLGETPCEFIFEVVVE